MSRSTHTRGHFGFAPCKATNCISTDDQTHINHDKTHTKNPQLKLITKQADCR